MSSGDLFGSDLLLSVALPRPLYQLFTYRLPAHLVSKVKVGGWVRVPFGSSHSHAFVVEPPFALEQLAPGLRLETLKCISEVGDEKYSIPSDVFAVCRWAHDYYCSPLGEVLNCAAPLAGIKKVEATVSADGKKPRARKSSEEGFKNTSVPIQISDLTSEQAAVLEELEETRQTTPGSVTLLQGVTGSGKTEIYIELARKVLAEGKGVLVLVPEIALTPQLHKRFEDRLGMSVGLWHSAVSQGKRRDQSRALVEGQMRILVGARSAVFAPMPNLGLIVVDEEHDPTFKQEDRVRYHARDLAIVRAKFTGAAVVLGSATPSLETLERVREKKFSFARLDRRYAQGGLPNVELVNLCEEELVPNTQAILATRTITAIQQTLAAGEQVMVFLNRRGFASFLVCKDCGEGKNCPECSISLTVHKRDRLLKCHVCGHQEDIPESCSKCRGVELQAVGAGTESLEAEIPKLVPEARVIRLDRDQITSTTRLNKILSDFRKGTANLLLGTQMLVKGHDFPGVTLVVVVLADALFRWPDFRASERAFQVLKQVAGRAGRREKVGRVLIQSFDVEHPVLLTVKGEMSEAAFLDAERELRQALSYPPFGRVARLRFESSHRNDAIERAKKVAELLSHEALGVQILGPSEAFLEKARGVYRWDLLLKGRDIQGLHKALFRAREFCLRQKWQFSADVDPFGL